MDENNQDAATDTGAAQEQIDNWGDAEAAFLADKGIKTEEDKKDPADDTDKPADKGTDGDADAGGEEDPNKKPADDAEDADPNDDPKIPQPDESAPYREARQVQREIEADRKAMVADVQKELYPDWSDVITDGDGDPIKTPRDVMKHINPATNKPFTEEEATAWLFAAQEHKDKQRQEMIERVEQVSDVMIDHRDQADQVKEKYGGLLAKLPNLRKEIFADYKATLVIDKETGLIVDAPVSMFRFFERALRPYEQYVKQMQTQAAKPKGPTDAERRQTHQDREDIHSASGGSVVDPEEAGWAKAAKEYYEGK